LSFILNRYLTYYQKFTPKTPGHYRVRVMIKAIIFDLGGVILTHTHEVTMSTLAEIFGVTEDKIQQAFLDIEDDWVTGKITAEKLAKKFKRKFKSKKSIEKIMQYWIAIYEKETEVNKDLLQLIDKLKGKYEVYLLTNTTDIHHNLNAKRNIFNHFNKIFASFLIGKRKPDRDFYLNVLKETNLQPKDTIFIDDREENLKPAKKLGMNVILFQNNKNLTTELKKLKVQII